MSVPEKKALAFPSLPPSHNNHDNNDHNNRPTTTMQATATTEIETVGLLMREVSSLYERTVRRCQFRSI